MFDAWQCSSVQTNSRPGNLNQNPEWKAPTEDTRTGLDQGEELIEAGCAFLTYIERTGSKHAADRMINGKEPIRLTGTYYIMARVVVGEQTASLNGPCQLPKPADHSTQDTRRGTHRRG
jgi:hypothetical protein